VHWRRWIILHICFAQCVEQGKNLGGSFKQSFSAADQGYGLCSELKRMSAKELVLEEAYLCSARLLAPE
jgi:hypothetical protein